MRKICNLASCIGSQSSIDRCSIVCSTIPLGANIFDTYELSMIKLLILGRSLSQVLSIHEKRPRLVSRWEIFRLLMVHRRIVIVVYVDVSCAVGTLEIDLEIDYITHTQVPG
jgi:hypothetical protein